jgi:hypothetical protein
MIDETKLTELIALAAKATPGPWISKEEYYESSGASFASIGAEEPRTRIASLIPGTAHIRKETVFDNAAYIVAACNLAPALAAEVVELRERNKQLDEGYAWKHENYVKAIKERDEALFRLAEADTDADRLAMVASTLLIIIGTDPADNPDIAAHRARVEAKHE